MENRGLSRRRFLAICGGGITGIWLASTGLIQLPARMVFAMSRSCSFCGKAADEIFGLAGITPWDVRICDECIDLCFDILAEEMGIRPPWIPQVEFDAAKSAEAQLIEELSRRIAAGERGDPLVDTFEAALTHPHETVIIRQPRPRPRIADLVCSFCNKNQREVAKLIAGPTVYICDGCIGDAGALFMRYGWRPGA